MATTTLLNLPAATALGGNEYMWVVQGGTDKRAVISLIGDNAQVVLFADTTYFVRPDGSDSNTGLENTPSGAFLTIQHAVDVVTGLDTSTFSATIQLGNGTYTAGTLVSTYENVSIVGDTTTPSNVIINVTGGFCFYVYAGSLSLSGVKLVNSGDNQIWVDTGGVLNFGLMEFGTSGGDHIHAVTGSIVYGYTGPYSITGGGAAHITSFDSFVEIGSVATLVGTPAFARFVNAEACGVINWVASIVGSATGSRFRVISNAVINPNGGGATFFPGNAVGTIASGGQYIDSTADLAGTVFPTKAAVQAFSPVVAPSFIVLAGYTTVDDTPLTLYKKAAVQPSHAGKLQSADGTWWELQGNIVTPEMFGGSETDTSANNTVFPEMCVYLAARGGGTVLLNKLYQKDAVFTVTQSKITFTSDNSGGIWLRGSSGGGMNHLISVVGASDVTVRGLQLRGDVGVARANAQFAILANGCDRFTVDQCYIHDALSGVWVWDSGYASITNNRMVDMAADGIHMNNGCLRFLINGNSLNGLGDDAIAVVGELTPPVGISLIRPAKGVISCNHVTRVHATGSGIRISEADVIDIIGNVVTDVGNGGIMVVENDSDPTSRPRWINIVSNIVSNYGLYYSGAPYYTDEPAPGVASAVGIGVHFGDYVNVSDNTLFEETPTGSGRGVHVDGYGTHVAVRNNRISTTTLGVVVTDVVYPLGDLSNVVIGNTDLLTLVGAFCIILDKVGSAPFTHVYIHDNVGRSNVTTHVVYVQNTVGADILVKDNVSFAAGAFATAGSSATVLSGNVTM